MLLEAEACSAGDIEAEQVLVVMTKPAAKAISKFRKDRKNKRKDKKDVVFQMSQKGTLCSRKSFESIEEKCR